jgi:hypothetical protein
MVATFTLLQGVDVTYLNKPPFYCRGVQKIVQNEGIRCEVERHTLLLEAPWPNALQRLKLMHFRRGPRLRRFAC